MLVYSLYLFWIGFTLFFGWMFNLYTNPFASIWWFVIAIISVIVSWLLSIIIQLIIISIYGEIRKGKPYDNMHNHRFTNQVLTLAMHLLRIKVIVTGTENIPKNQNFVFMSNHQENYDIIILKRLFPNHPLNFIAKKSLFKTPVIGKWIELLGNIPISRHADREAAKAIIMGIKRAKQGIPMGIFPEGKRSFSNEMIPFKAGAFKLAMKSKQPILIGTIYNVVNVLKGYPFKKQVVYVHFHPLLPYEEFKDKTSYEVSDYVRDIIQEQLNTFKQHVAS